MVMFFLSLVAMTALQFFRYQAISQDIGIQIKPGSPLDVIGAFTFSWVFFVLLRKAAKGDALTHPKKLMPEVSRQTPSASASVASTTEPSAAPPTQRLHGTEDVPKLRTVLDADALIPSEERWAAALAEFESVARRPGLWAKTFAEADGNEAVAKAGYLRSRSVELETEQSRIATLHHADELRNAALRQQAVEAEARKREAERMEAEQAHAALAKGVCPNGRCKAVIQLNSQACLKCGAIFEKGAAWKVLPWKQT